MDAFGLISPAKVMFPPARVMFPDAEPKLIAPELTLPETLIVPAASPAVLVPNHSASAVVVVVFPDNALTPVEEVLHP